MTKWAGLHGTERLAFGITEMETVALPPGRTSRSLRAHGEGCEEREVYQNCRLKLTPKQQNTYPPAPYLLLPSFPVRSKV